MKKTFTKDDIIKKHNTNVVSAGAMFIMTGILGVVYIVRFIITGNFNFYFSLSFTDMVLKIGQEKGSFLVPAILTAVFLVIYLVSTVLCAKNSRFLILLTGIYLFDFASLITCMAFLWEHPLNPDCYIDLIIHLIVTVFLVVGVRSEKKLRYLKADEAESKTEKKESK